MSLPRRSRLAGPTAFRNVFEKPAVSADACFKVLARQNAVMVPRLGLAVSRQVDKRAVARNRLKRIIRESFRAHYLASSVDISPETTIDVVVLPRRQAVSVGNNQLFEMLSRHWNRIDRRLQLPLSPDSRAT